MPDNGQPRPGSTPVKRTPGSDAKAAPKRAELLVALIEDRVEQEKLKPGDSLGTEPQLMARYDVSRETFRKAVRQLERHGVAVMRRGGGGGGGGLVVASAAEDTVVHAIATHLEYSSIGWADIVEARALIDIEAAALASQRVDAAGAEHLRQLGAELERGQPTVHDIARRHLSLPSALADASGNPVLRLFAQALNRWTLDILPSELGSAAELEREMRRVNTILRELAETVANGNEAGSRQAAAAFAAHSMTVSGMLERRRHRADASEWMQTTGGDGAGKLAQRLALALARDIAARGWPRERFGDEAGLITRFGVSRSVLREAIRLLEMHGILRPQRGRGGGLMIGQPDPRYTIDCARRYLRRAGLGPADYLAVRHTLENGAIHLAVQRADEAGMAELKAIGLKVGEADDSAVTPMAIAWHAQLSQLGGNQALSLLLRILFALTEEPYERLPADIAAQLRDRHLRLTQALVARNEALAQSIAADHVRWLRGILDSGLGSLAPLPPGGGKAG